MNKIINYRTLEEKMCRSFENFIKPKWREGNNKTSFNYLLLDPRISLNLPERAHETTMINIWKCFLSSIFYIGKGKRCRPYAHLHEAVSGWKKQSHSSNEKVCLVKINDKKKKITTRLDTNYFLFLFFR